MAQLLSDDGQVATWLNDLNQEVHVASQFAPSSLPSMGAIPAQQPAQPDPAPAELNFAPDDLSQPQPSAALATPGPAIQQQLPTERPPAIAAPPEAAPAEPPPLEMPPDDLSSPPPDITPTGPLNKPTQIADEQIKSLQTQSDSAHAVADAQVGAADQIINASKDAQYQADEYQKQRDAELQQRQNDEAELQEKHDRLVKNYANFKVDPNRGQSTERQTMAWIGAAIAGLGQVISGKDPSQNPVIPMIFAQMDKRVQQQMAERDAMGNAIGMSKDGLVDFRNATKTRLGEYDLRMAGAYEKAAKFTDTVKGRLGAIQEREAAKQMSAALRAQAATHMGSAVAAEAEARARARAAVAAARKAQAKAQEDAARWRADKGMMPDGQGGYVPDPRFADPTKALAAQGAALDIALKQRDLAGNDPKNAAADLAIRKDAAARSINDFDGKPLMRTVTQKDASGKDVEVAVPALAKDEKAQQVITDSQAAVSKVVRASRLLRIAMKNGGGSSAVLASDEYQQAKSLLSTIDMANKDALGLGVLTGPDLKILEGVRGGADPTSFVRDAAVGLKSMEDRAIEGHDAVLKAKSDYFDSKAAKQQKPPELAAATVAEQSGMQRVATFTKGDPSVAGDAQATTRDAELRLEAASTWLKRDKPSFEAIDGAIRQAMADNYMPPATKAQVIATLTEAKDKLDTPEQRAMRKVGKAAAGLPGTEHNLFPDSARFNIPVAGEK